MEIFMLITVLLMSICLVVGFYRVIAGPTRSDSLLAVQFSSTVAIGILLLLSVTSSLPYLIDIAMVIAILGLPATLAFTRLDSAHTIEEQK